MALPINPLLPLGGIALILSMVWLMGGRRERRIASADEAAAALNVPEIAFRAERLALGRDGLAAIAVDAAGRLGLVVPAGAHLVARVLKAGDVTEARLDGDALALSTRASSHANFRVALPPGEAAGWLDAALKLLRTA